LASVTLISVRTQRGVKRESRTIPGIGARLRQARLKAELTQQALAGDRYTKAYVSALENSLVNPSMVALEYLAERLGTTASQLISDDHVGWQRLEADLLLASGELREAVDRYQALLPATVDPVVRADILRGAAEALVRLDELEPATEYASEALELYDKHQRPLDAARARYWLALALHNRDQSDEARELLLQIRDAIDGGLAVGPDLHLRVLISLARLESAHGDHQAALSYLDSIRRLAEEVDVKRRGDYLREVALSHRERGDIGAAMRAGYGSRALLNAAHAEVKLALLENDLAISELASGSISRAEQLAASARQRCERAGEDQLVASTIETQARVQAAAGNPLKALELAAQSLALAESAGNPVAAVDALLTSGRVFAAQGDKDRARDNYERAADKARQLGRQSVVRRALTQWADHLATIGDHRAAFELTREALGS
jgi:tetratricopeptide (TPR) repeat protein